jgi:hypothetical protein
MRNQGRISRLPEENDVGVDATNPRCSIERILNIAVSDDSRVTGIRALTNFKHPQTQAGSNVDIQSGEHMLVMWRPVPVSRSGVS